MRGKELVKKTKSFVIWRDKVSGYEFAQIGNFEKAVMIIPQCQTGELLLIEKWGVASGRREVVFPGGKVEPNESELEAARRELKEETGLVALKIKNLLRLEILPGYLVGQTVIMIAEVGGGEEEAEDKLEVRKILRCSGEKVREMIDVGTIRDARTVAAYLMFEAGKDSAKLVQGRF